MFHESGSSLKAQSMHFLSRLRTGTLLGGTLPGGGMMCEFFTNKGGTPPVLPVEKNLLPILHKSICIFMAGLSSLSDGWIKYKEKVLDVSDSNQNVKTTCNSKLKFTELKDLFIKRVQKN